MNPTTNMHTPTHRHTHAHTHTHTQPHINMHTCTQTQPHTNMHTPTHTHTHTCAHNLCLHTETIRVLKHTNQLVYSAGCVSCVLLNYKHRRVCVDPLLFLFSQLTRHTHKSTHTHTHI